MRNLKTVITTDQFYEYKDPDGWAVDNGLVHIWWSTKQVFLPLHRIMAILETWEDGDEV